ncbi:hypothetical protein OG223_25130 [Streptomyces sp. NBC_01478]|uniref:hypothetical protein n=1 Tax=Streptomyces sp. NBC_01478 TaxID=2903882 RepID=UPI002E37AD59|nr:hypothetical protein [Streptomyces sp. NBC_01478]
MTAPALTRTAPPRPARPRRALLRLHRPALIAWGVFVAVISAVLLWAYGPLGNSAHAAWQQQCTEDVCDWNDAIEGYHLAYTLSEVAIGFLPILVAVWAGGLLIGRELENGTASLAWTQSISPARWLATKLAVPAALLTAGTTLLVLLHRLLFDAHQVPDGWGWNDHNTFYANGTVAIAFPLLGLTVGALTGLVQRRALAGVPGAVALTGVSYLISWASPRLVPWKTSVGDLKEGYAAPANVIYGGEGAVTSTGAHIPDPCVGGGKACPAAHDIVGYYSEYHPSSQFWPLQLTETALVLAVAALAAAAAFTLLRRRTA